MRGLLLISLCAVIITLSACDKTPNPTVKEKSALQNYVEQPLEQAHQASKIASERDTKMAEQAKELE